MHYGLAAMIGVPLCLYYKPWRGFSILQIALLSFILGPIYILAVFAGFLFAPAAHDGIFMNGILPLISILFAIVLMRVLRSMRQVLGALILEEGLNAVSVLALVFLAIGLLMSVRRKSAVHTE